MGFLVAQTVKKSACNAKDLGSIPGSGRSPGEGSGNPLQYSGLENSMDSVVHGAAKSQTQLSDFHFVGHFSGEFWTLTYPGTRKGKKDQLKCS